MNHLYTYDEMLNEGIISDFLKENYDKIKSLINNKLQNLSSLELEEIERSIKPYENLSYREIKSKINLKLQNYIYESIDHLDIDPYNEEEWDEEKEEEWDEEKNNRRYNINKILNILNKVFASSMLINFYSSIFIAIFFNSDSNILNTIVNVTFIASIISLVLWVLVGGPRRL